MLANRSISGVAAVICEQAPALILGEDVEPNLLDRALQISERYQALHDAREDALRATADPNAPPTLSLSDYAGCYRHPAFGELELRSTEDGLAASFHGIDLEVEHLHDDVFVLSSIYTDDMEGRFAISNGAAGSLVVPLGSPSRPRTFTRAAESSIQRSPDPGDRASEQGDNYRCHPLEP